MELSVGSPDVHDRLKINPDLSTEYRKIIRPEMNFR